MSTTPFTGRLVCASTANQTFNGVQQGDLLIHPNTNSSQKVIAGTFNNANAALCIQQNNVGINTLTPQSTLDVQGNTTITGTLGINTTTPETTLDVQGNATIRGSLNVIGGDILKDGVVFKSGGGGAGATLWGTPEVGTSNVPIDGGTLNLDITANNNAVIELASTVPSPALTINLYEGPTNPNWSTNIIGTSGNIVLIERSVVGRTVNVDSRLKFPAPQSSPFQTTTAFFNGYAVDTISYFIPKDIFGFANYTRQFKATSNSIAVKWIAQITGTGDEVIYGLATATDGGLIVTGSYSSDAITFKGAKNVENTVNESDFPTQLLNSAYTSQGSKNGFIAKYGVLGNVEWVAQLGNSTSGSQVFIGRKCTRATDGGIFVVGTYSGATFTAYNSNGSTFTTRQPTNSGEQDIFIVKYTNSGTVSWVTNLSGASIEATPDIAGTSDGGCVVVFSYNSSSVSIFDSAGNSTTLSLSVTRDIGIVKFDSTGRHTSAGGTGWLARISNQSSDSTAPVSVCVGDDGGIYVCGQYGASTLNIYDKTLVSVITTLPKSSHTREAFIVKYTSTGDIAQTSGGNRWTTHIGGNNASGVTSPTDIIATSDGGLVVGGCFVGSLLYFYSPINNSTQNTTWPITASSTTLNDAFVAKYSSQGEIQWITTFKGSGTDLVRSVALTTTGDVIVTGNYDSSPMTVYTGPPNLSINAPSPNQGAYGTTLTHSGGTDTFVCRLKQADGLVDWIARLAGSLEDTSYDTTVLSDSGIVVGGSTYSTTLNIYDKTQSPYTLTLTDDTVLYEFTSHTFTTAGIIGPYGPSLNDILSAYSSASWATNRNNLTLLTEGVQIWTVPKTGFYNFIVSGARGGNTNDNDNIRYGGLGFIFNVINVRLLAGEKLYIIVGQLPIYWNGTSEISGAGGGASIVFRGESLLFVAGGGGGAGYGFVSPQGPQPSSDILTGTGASSGVRGFNGKSLTYNLNGTVRSVVGGTGGSTSSGGEGGKDSFGLSTGGSGANGRGGNSAAYNNAGGGGGVGTNTSLYRGGNETNSLTAGGFGGGGGGARGGGGGGGYGGGGGGGAAPVDSTSGTYWGTTAGGGGGSYIGTGSLISTNNNNKAGYVTITLQNSYNAFLVKMDPSGLMSDPVA